MTEDPRDTATDVVGLPREDQAKAAEWARSNWYWFLIAGIIAVVFGALALANLWNGIEALAFLVGFALLYIGVVDWLTSGRAQPRWMGILPGLLALGGGVIALVYPGSAPFALAIISGASFVV